MPSIKNSIDYFYKSIDKNGIIQFEKLGKKDYRFGYAVEDQARALIVARKLNDIFLVKKLEKLINLTGATDEAIAEVIWATGNEKLSEKIQNSPYLRVWAYAILGLHDPVFFANRLIKKFDGYWFEKKLTYANALLPWSLFTAYEKTKNKKYLEVANKSLDFLTTKLKISSVPIVVGNKGWWTRGKPISLFDQQPIDVSYMVMAAISAKRYAAAKFYYSWFFGNNIKKVSMIKNNGACFDGLTPKGPNENTGAESLICFLLAAINVREHKLLDS